MLGQPASSHTVCSPSRRTRLLSSVNCGPIRARVLIHGGFFSIGVSALRASTRSNLRPSGTTALTNSGYASRTHLDGIAGLHDPGLEDPRIDPADARVQVVGHPPVVAAGE